MATSRRLGHYARLALLGLSLALAGGAASPAFAKTINLGGKADDKTKPQIRYIELPRILVALPRDDGGWNHVQIDSYLAPADEETMLAMDGVRSSIARHASEDELPKIGYENLKKASFGSEFAKQAIRVAAERSLGRPWKGDVFIRSMLTY
jgi:hypothetical protein